MIEKLSDTDILSNLKDSHYTNKILSNYNAYGMSYDFCSFYKAYNDVSCAAINIFNSNMIITETNDKSDYSTLKDDIVCFINMLKPEMIECDEVFSSFLELYLKDYNIDERTFFVYDNSVANSENVKLDIKLNPSLDSIYNILSVCFEQMKNCYELWLTDTSHRIRRNQSEIYLMNNTTTASVAYKLNKKVFLCHVATMPSARGKNQARILLSYICEKYKNQGYDVCLFARKSRTSFYNSIGFIPSFKDKVFERTQI